MKTSQLPPLYSKHPSPCLLSHEVDLGPLGAFSYVSARSIGTITLIRVPGHPDKGD